MTFSLALSYISLQTGGASTEVKWGLKGAGCLGGGWQAWLRPMVVGGDGLLTMGAREASTAPTSVPGAPSWGLWIQAWI